VTEQKRSPAQHGRTGLVYVWDPFVRIVHWTLVGAVGIAYLVTSGPIHRWAGIAVGLLVAARLVWGFVGPHHARFADFLYPPSVMAGYVADLVRLKPQERRLGHSPGGGYVITGLLILLAAACLSGLIATGETGARWHAGFAYAALILTVVHICGVLLRSYVYGENLIWAKFTGYKRK
jgi:cytochrome b